MQNSNLRWKNIRWAQAEEHYKITRGFSGGPVVKNLPANTRDVGSIPGPGWVRMLPGNQARVQQARSQCAANTEARAAHEKPPPREARAPQLESGPCYEDPVEP